MKATSTPSDALAHPSPHSLLARRIPSRTLLPLQTSSTPRKRAPLASIRREKMCVTSTTKRSYAAAANLIAAAHGSSPPHSLRSSDASISMPRMGTRSLATKRRAAEAIKAVALGAAAPAPLEGEPLADEISSPSRKVAIFVEPSPFSHVSGMKIRFANLIKGLRELGDDVDVFTPCVDPPDTFHGAKVHKVLGFRLPLYNSPTLLLSLGVSLRVLARLVARRPDVIHVSAPGMMVFAVILYARLLRIPLVVSYHTHIPEYIPKYTWKGLVKPMWSVIRAFTRAADLTLVPSATMKATLSGEGCGQPIDVWRQAVDTEFFNPRFRSAKGRKLVGATSDDDVVLTYVGRLGAEKNLGVLRELLASLPENARISFVGDGPARAELEAQFAADPRVSSRVRFTGMLRGEELASAYSSADIFVMPSETETLGFVALEAMASKLPAVCVAAGGLRDIVTLDGEIGFLYPPNDYDALRKIVAKLVESKAERERVGANARRHVESMGWLPSVRSVREGPYSRAIVRFGKRVLERKLWWKVVMSRVAALVAFTALSCFLALVVGGRPAEVAAEGLRRFKSVLPFGLGGVAL